MIIAFDSVNRYEVPLFHLCDPGCKYEDGLLTRAIGILPNTSDEELVLNFNAKSELNLRVNKIRYDNAEENAFFLSIYNKIANRRSIFVEGYGFFTITDVTEGYQDYQSFKDIQACSCEQEIEDKKVPYIDGTYPMLTQDSDEGILNILVERLPSWQIHHVDASVGALYRTFEDVDTDRNVLSFMLEDMQEAYECIIIFDTLHRYIDVYDQNSYVVSTDIHITREDLIDSCKVEENSDDLYTALSVVGYEDLSINGVNPLGTSVIYDFSYYLDWMSPALSTKVQTWQELVSDNATPYYNYATQYYQQLSIAADAGHEVDRINIVLDMYRRCRENIVAESGTSQVASYNAVISANGGDPIPTDMSDIEELKDYIDGLIEDAEAELTTATWAYDTANAQAASINTNMQAIRDLMNIQTYFTDAEYDELANYIIEGKYNDEFITVTDNMTESEKLAQMKTLYDRAVSTLEKAAYPTQKYTVDVENFLFQKKFQHFSEQLETGCLVNVEAADGDVAALFLATIEVNWDDQSLSLTFGNRYNRFDPKALFNNVLGSVQKSANSIEYIKELLTPIANGELVSMQNAIANSRNLAKNEAMSATNEVVLIDDTGYTGRKLLEDGESFDPRQIKIVNNQIVFTDDAWETAKTAIGEIQIPGSQNTKYGVNAELLVGDLILGNQIQIGYSDSGGNTHDITSGILESLSTQYYESTSANETSGGSWVSTLPSPRQPDTFLWIRDVYTYADGNVEYGEPVCTEGVPGADGQPGTDGESPITIQIESSNGNIFYRTGLQTILSCHVYDGRAEITNTIPQNKFDWHKKNNDGTEDTDWYSSNIHTGPTLIVDNDDIFNRAVFICNVTLDD